MKSEEKGIGGKPTIRITGANLQVVSGPEESETNGAGNIVIGTDEGPRSQTSSNNLVLGIEQEWTSYGGIVAGEHSSIQGPFASGLGGGHNTASGLEAVVSGGSSNNAESLWAAILGGSANTVVGQSGSIAGGSLNTIAGGGVRSSISGGVENTTSAIYASISGGSQNKSGAAY